MSANKGYRRPERTLRHELELHHEEEQENAREWADLRWEFEHEFGHYEEAVAFENDNQPSCKPGHEPYDPFWLDSMEAALG